MPNIRSSADLRNSYNEISTFCHEYAEPVFITKNGKGDLAVMSIEAYEQLAGRCELYGLLQEGMDDLSSGKTRPFSEAIISQAADYIEFVLKNPKAADDLLEETDQKINALLPFSQEHPIVEDKLLAAWGIRFTQIKNYLAFYVVEENQVTVIRFLYAKSDWISILKVGFPLV